MSYRHAHALELTVQCPAEIETGSLWEGAYYVECRCDLTVVIEAGSDVPGGWRVLDAPGGCPLNPYGECYSPGERVVLDTRIEQAWENWEPTDGRAA